MNNSTIRKTNQYQKYDKLFTIKVNNISYNTTVHQIRELCSKFGHIGDIYIPRCAGSPKSQGYAFVRYYDKINAVKAAESLNETELQGRKIYVAIAELKKSRPNAPVYNPQNNFMFILPNKDEFNATSCTDIATRSGSSPSQYEEAYRGATDQKQLIRVSNLQLNSPAALRIEMKESNNYQSMQELTSLGSDNSSLPEGKYENQVSNRGTQDDVQTENNSFADTSTSLIYKESRDNDRISETKETGASSKSTADGRRSPTLGNNMISYIIKNYDNDRGRAESHHKRRGYCDGKGGGNYYSQVFEKLKRQRIHDIVFKGN